MSVENLIKELDAVHAQIKSAATVRDKQALMAARDELMRTLGTARLAQAEHDLNEIKRLEEQQRAKTVQLPRTR